MKLLRGILILLAFLLVISLAAVIIASEAVTTQEPLVSVLYHRLSHRLILYPENETDRIGALLASACRYLKLQDDVPYPIAYEIHWYRAVGGDRVEYGVLDRC